MLEMESIYDYLLIAGINAIVIVVTFSLPVCLLVVYWVVIELMLGVDLELKFRLMFRYEKHFSLMAILYKLYPLMTLIFSPWQF